MHIKKILNIVEEQFGSNGSRKIYLAALTGLVILPSMLWAWQGINTPTIDETAFKTSLRKSANFEQRYALVAYDRYEIRKGPGPEHGGDPHDEHHDGGLPAKEHEGDGYPSGDPYNGSTGNNTDHPNRPY